MNIEDLDPLLGDAAQLIVSNQSGSTSLLQRRMKLGYNRAGRLMDQLEAIGIVGPHRGALSRDVLIKDVNNLSDTLLNVGITLDPLSFKKIQTQNEENIIIDSASNKTESIKKNIVTNKNIDETIYPVTFMNFMKNSFIKRDVLEQMNKRTLYKYLIITFLLFISSLIISINIDWYSFYILSGCGVLICIFLLKEKIRINNICPKCNAYGFKPLIESKSTYVSFSTSKSIHERGLNGKFIGSYQEGTTVDGAKYEIRETNSRSEENFYDWICNKCKHTENEKESFSHYIYLLGIIIGIAAIYGFLNM
jgi:hypothetical protein